MQLIFNNKLLFKTGKTLQMANKLKKMLILVTKLNFRHLQVSDKILFTLIHNVNKL